MTDLNEAFATLSQQHQTTNVRMNPRPNSSKDLNEFFKGGRGGGGGGRGGGRGGRGVRGGRGGRGRGRGGRGRGRGWGPGRRRRRRFWGGRRRYWGGGSWWPWTNYYYPSWSYDNVYPYYPEYVVDDTTKEVVENPMRENPFHYWIIIAILIVLIGIVWRLYKN